MEVGELLKTLSMRPPAARVFIERAGEGAVELETVAAADEVAIVNAEGMEIPTGEELVVVLRPKKEESDG